MRTSFKNCALGAAAAALMLSSTAGVAASASPAPAPETQSAWMALSMLSPVGTSALGGAAVAAQPVPPPPPAYYDRSDSIPPPPIPVLAVWLATLLVIIYIATRHDRHHVPEPNSPA